MQNQSGKYHALLRAYFRNTSAPEFQGKGLVSGGIFTEKYCTLYLNYQRLLESYLLMRLPLKRYDDSIQNAGLYFQPTDWNRQDFFQRISFPQLRYIYLRNPLHVEKLSLEDMDLVIRQDAHTLSKPGNELLRLINRTYKAVVDAAPAGDTSGARHMVCYGPDDDDYWHDSRKLIFGIRHDEFAKTPLGENTAWFDNFNKQLEFLGNMMLDLEQGCSEILNFPVAFLYYDEAAVLCSLVHEETSKPEPPPQPKPHPKAETKSTAKQEPKPEPKKGIAGPDEVFADEGAELMRLATKIQQEQLSSAELTDTVRTLVRAIPEFNQKAKRLPPNLQEGGLIIRHLVATACRDANSKISDKYGDRMLPLGYELMEIMAREFSDLPKLGKVLQEDLRFAEENILLIWSLVQKGTKVDIPLDWLNAVVKKISPKHKKAIRTIQKNASQKKPVGVARMIVFGLLALVCVLMIFTVSKGISGVAALEQGNYDTAVSNLHYAVFHQEQYQEALKKREDQTWADAKKHINGGGYDTALELCESKGYPELYREACILSGNACLEDGRNQLANHNATLANEHFTDCLSYYALLEDNAQMKDANNRIGLAYMDYQYFDKALSYLDPTSKAYSYCKGMESLSALNGTTGNAWSQLSATHTLFKNSRGVADSDPYISLLDKLTQNQFMEAVTQIQDTQILQEVLSLKNWAFFFNRLRQSSSKPTLNDRLNLECAIGTLAPSERELEKDTLARIIDRGDSAIASPIEDDDDVSCPEKEELLKMNRDTAAGKVLIIKGTRLFTSDQHKWAVDFGLMQLLPTSWIPADLSEVEYLVTITYDFKDSGRVYRRNFGYGSAVITKGLQENAVVHVYSLKTGASLYVGSTVRGPAAPSSFSSSDSLPPFVTGGRPEIAEQLLKALKHVQGRIK